MAIGERIHFFRTLRGMTQKYLGMAVGFPERSADVRLAQYETGTRTPKADLTAALAHTLDVSPQALSVPDIDNYIGLAHTLFALEDVYSLKVVEADGRACLQADIFQGGRQASELNKILIAWREPPGRSRPRSWRPGRSPRRTMTAGATTTRSTTPPSGGPKSPRRN